MAVSRLPLLSLLLPLSTLSCRDRLRSDGEPPAPATSIAAPAANPHFIGSEPFPQRPPAGRPARPRPTPAPPPTALPEDDL